MVEAGMELHTLQPPKGSKKDRRRLGRGTGSGLGKTCGRGHKGAGQRSGFKRKAIREGGQMPLHRRLPKHGFTNIFKKEWQIVNVSDLTRCEPGEVGSPVSPLHRSHRPVRRWLRVDRRENPLVCQPRHPERRIREPAEVVVLLLRPPPGRLADGADDVGLRAPLQHPCVVFSRHRVG